MTKYLSLFLIIFMACSADDSNNQCLIYRECIDDFEGRFCTNGMKFGKNIQYQSFGVDVDGPGESGEVVTYSFQTSGVYPTFQFGDFASRPFDEIGTFAMDKVRQSLEEWASHIDLTFEETDDEENSDLKIICADIEDKAGIGWSRCADIDCTEIEGFVFLKNNPFSQGDFYSLALHEIGHALGLCHSNPNNIMSHNSNSYNFDELQPGDIEGIISIYGAK